MPNRFTRKNSQGMNKQVGEEGFQKKSLSGPMTTVGEMIPFQRASRREPHLRPQPPERDRSGPNKRTVQKKSSIDQSSQNPTGEHHAHDDSGYRSGKENVSIPPSDAKRTLPNIKQKARPPDSKHPQARSVRPKLKGPAVSRGQNNSPPSQQSYSSTGAQDASTGANHRRLSDQEVVSISSTSPRRRIVRRKSQTNAAAERSSNSSQVEVLPGCIDTDNTNPNSAQETSSSSTIVGNSLDTSMSLLQAQVEPLNRSLPETQIRADLNSETTDVRRNTNQESSDSLHRSSNQTSAELRPRPMSSARVPLSRRSGDIRNRLGNERPTIQPSIASATELDGSSNTSAEMQERHPNSVRRSLDRPQTGNRMNTTEDRPRLTRQSISGTTPSFRQREMIDVNAAASVLSRRVPPSAVQSGQVRSNPRTDVTPIRQEHDTPPNEEDVWVPQRRPNGRNSASAIQNQRQNSLVNSPRTQEPSITPRDGGMNTPDVVFRESPVADVPQRRFSRLSSDHDDFPSLANTTRPAPTMPSRRGLYRALSVNDTSDHSHISDRNRNNSTQSNQRDMPFIGAENIDSDDIDSWRRIESEHSYPSREPRQRLIYQDRARSRDTIVNRNAPGGRQFTSTVDSMPDINDEEEFPPLGGMSSNATSVGQASVASHDQTSFGSEFGTRYRRNETPPPTPTPGRNAPGERDDEETNTMVEHLVLLASPIFGPLMLQASPAVLFNMLSRARRDFGGEFVELLIENVVLSLLAQHTFDATAQTQGNNGAPPPATQETIESLHKVTVTKQMVSEDAFCAICHCEYAVDETLDQLPCKHNFHNQCITVWLNKSGTCPVCRHKLYTEGVDQL